MIPRPATPRVPDLVSPEEVTDLAAPVVRAAERLRLVTGAAAAQKARAAGELRQALLRLGCGVAGLEVAQRDELTRALYWGQPDIPVRDLVVALGFTDQRDLAAAAGPVETGVACLRCSTPFLATTRSRLAEVQKADVRRSRWDRRSTTCDPCRQAEDRAEAEAWEAECATAGNEEDWYPPDRLWDDVAGFGPAA